MAKYIILDDIRTQSLHYTKRHLDWYLRHGCSEDIPTVIELCAIKWSIIADIHLKNDLADKLYQELQELREADRYRLEYDGERLEFLENLDTLALI